MKNKRRRYRRALTVKQRAEKKSRRIYQAHEGRRWNEDVRREEAEIPF